MTRAEIAQWIDNDEGLYDWWRGSRQSKSAFITENRADLTACIERVTSNKAPAHYLKYGN